MSKREGWGDHDMARLADLLRQDLRARSRSPSRSKAEDVCTNDCIAAANDFDHAKVKADADAYKLSDAFAAIDVENVKAHLFDQAVPG